MLIENTALVAAASVAGDNAAALIASSRLHSALTSGVHAGSSTRDLSPRIGATTDGG